MVRRRTKTCGNMETCAKRLESVDMRGTIKTRFGNIPAHDTASFRRAVLLDDSCFMLTMDFLMN
ncbi:hypothetical protein L914_11332 [Phytophthora nicotianae]|uniref:Uncharacterized protein n=1 Tax=Phytophthora nicotianae TaxID=4792 RepID=W2N5F9_PHYNI|nr:hypothetical protein L914_11332 [Phytophthora nicotianae]